MVRPPSDAVSGNEPFGHSPGAQISLGLRQPAHRHEHQRHRGVGDFVVEHAGRMGDDDPVLRRPFGVDMVVADAETGDDLEVRQPAHEGRVDGEL